jgi:non-specific serine/threonine protein kinase
VALSGDRHLVASGNFDGMVRLWEAAGGRLLATLQGHTGTVWGVALSGDGQLVASGGFDGMAKLWDAPSGLLLATLRGHMRGVEDVALSRDGRLLASGSQDGMVRLWETATGRLLATLEGHTGGVLGVALSADGQLLASGGMDKMVRLWESSSGRVLATLRGHSAGVPSVALSGDGRLLASGSFDGTIRLWETTSGRLLAILEGHTAGVLGVALSADGQLLASSSYDGSVLLWDAPTGSRLRTLRIDRLYERMNISGLTGVTDAERAALLALGAVEEAREQVAPADLARAAHPPPAVPVSPAERIPARPSTNLLPARTTFVGRTAEVASLTRALDQATGQGTRLLTLTGVAGCGKTRLTLAAALAVAEAYAGGIWLVELAPLPASSASDPTAVLAVSLAALGLPELPGQAPLDTLVARLQRSRVLLILDNCEHVVAACATLATRLLGACPELQILASSQQALGIAEETVWPVTPLTLPPPPAQALTEDELHLLRRSEAVQLFLERAQAVQPGFALTAENAPAVGAICLKLDGLPLAIELAAARLGVLPLEEILARLDDRFRLLRRGGRTDDERHRTLQATLDWSYGLLDPAAQALLRRLAVFVGGWDVAAAEAICAGEELTAGAVLDLLDELVDRSLVYVQETGGAPRSGMLETVRQYGLQLLEHMGELAVVRNRHLHWCVTLAEQAASALLGPEQIAWLARLEREHDNLRAAIQWALDRDLRQPCLRLAAGLWQFWRGHRSHLSEGRRWLAAVLARTVNEDDATDMALRASALEGAAWLAEDEHDFARASAMFAQSDALRRALGQDERTTGLLINEAMEARAGGEYGRATALLEACLARHRALGNRESINRGGLGLSLSRLALVLAERGAYAQATALYEECVALHRGLGDREGEGYALLGLGDVVRDQGDTGRVRVYCGESLAIFRELEHPLVGFSLNNLALAAYLDGDLALAATRAQESEALFRELQAEPNLAEVLVTVGRVKGAKGEGEAAQASLAEALRLAWAKGPRWVVAAALEELGVQAIRQGEARHGVTLLAVAASLREAMGAPVRPADRSSIEGALAAARASLGDKAVADAWATGQTLPLEQIVTLGSRR